MPFKVIQGSVPALLRPPTSACCWRSVKPVASEAQYLAICDGLVMDASMTEWSAPRQWTCLWSRSRKWVDQTGAWRQDLFLEGEIACWWSQKVIAREVTFLTPRSLCLIGIDACSHRMSDIAEFVMWQTAYLRRSSKTWNWNLEELLTSGELRNRCCTLCALNEALRRIRASCALMSASRRHSR